MPDSAQTSHPGVAKLADFALGKLAGAENAALQEHLVGCPACRKAIASLPKAAAGGESVSGHETLVPAGLVLQSPRAPDVTTAYRPESDVPADLANHPKFEILQLLGQGGMGAVYKARHKIMNRLVAIKVINASLVASSKAVERFHREVQAAAKLHHPNIVTAYDADQAGDTHFLVMEFVEGTDLAKLIEKKGPLPVAHACHYIRQAALGLQQAHKHGMVHRDIKPHNLMLTAGSVVKVMDFGLALLAREGASEAGLTGENVLMGTADYIAPEQAEDAHKADIRADIYSLGCTLYHLLKGKPPFEGGTVVQKIAGHLLGNVPLAELPATVPAELRTVLAKMVEKDPAKRYQTPAEVAQAMLPFVSKVAPKRAETVAAPIPRKDSEKQPVIPTQEVAIGEDVPAGAPERGARPAKKPSGKKKRAERNRRIFVAITVVAVALMLTVGLVAYRLLRKPPPSTPSEVAGSGLGGGDTVKTAPLPSKFKNSLGMEFVLVPKGKFLMGGGGGKPGDKKVEIPYDFYLGAYEVTQEEWVTVTDSLQPSHFSRKGAGKEAMKDIPDAQLKLFPVENVSWDEAQLFVKRLNERDKQAGWVYRLPKETEWEYACRGGPLADELDSAYDFYFDKATNQLLPEQANFNNGLKRTCKVGSYKPNRLGLYDMHGDVWEWCDDTEGASHRVYRGGGWDHDSGNCRAANRVWSVPSNRNNNLGLRLARVPVGK